MAFELPKLDYAYNALEPNIDALTMEIHHTKHHAAYTNNLNAALEGTPNAGKSIEELLAGISKLSVAIRNNGGGYYNHNMFWKVIGPNGGGKPSGDLLAAIEKNFGSFDAFKEELQRLQLLVSVLVGLACKTGRWQTCNYIYTKSGQSAYGYVVLRVLPILALDVGNTLII